MLVVMMLMVEYMKDIGFASIAVAFELYSAFNSNFRRRIPWQEAFISGPMSSDAEGFGFCFCIASASNPGFAQKIFSPKEKELGSSSARFRKMCFGYMASKI